MTQYFSGSGGGALSRAHARIAERQQADARLSRAKAVARKKNAQKDDGFSLTDLAPNLGLGEVVDMVPGIIGGVKDLVTGRGGYGHAWGNFGKGLLSSVASTARVAGDVASLGATELPVFGGKSVMDLGSDNLGNLLASTDAEEKAGVYKPSGIDKYWEQGIVPSLIEDVGNVAMAGGAAAKLAKLGTVGRLAEVGRTAEAATAAGFDGADIARAAEVADGGGFRKFAKAGVSNPKLKAVGKAFAKADGLEAPAEEVASRAGLIDKLDKFAHPYHAAYDDVIRPLTRAGQDAKLARVAATGAEVATDGKAVDTPDVPMDPVFGNPEAGTESRVPALPDDAGPVPWNPEWGPGEHMNVEAANGHYDDAYVSNHPDYAARSRAADDLLPENELAFLEKSPEANGPARVAASRARRAAAQVPETVPARSPLEQAGAEAAAYVDQQAAATNPRAANDQLLAGNTETKVPLYRGEPAANAGAARGSNFHSDYEYARNIAGDDGIVYRVDVPKKVADQAANWADRSAEIGGEPLTPGTHVLPPKWADAAFPDEATPGALDAEAAVDETGKARAQAPHADTPGSADEALGTPPRMGPHEDRVRRLADEPIPDWAKKAVARLPERAQGALDWAEGHLEGRETHAVVNERRRMMEAARRELFHHEAVQGLVRAAMDHLVGKTTNEGVEITPDAANQMLGNAAIMRLDATSLLEKALDAGAGVEELHRIIGAEGRIIPPELMTPELNAAIDTAVEQWRGLFEKRVDILRGGRLGAQGLEGVGDDVPLMSKAEVRIWKQVQRDVERSRRQDVRIEAERARGTADVQRSSAKIDTLDALIENLENRKGQAAADLEQQWTYTPRLLADDMRPKAIERLIDSTDTNGGGVFDPHARTLDGAFPVAAKYGGAQSGYGVAANMGTLARVTLEDWQANAPAILDRVLTDPAHADQLAHPDVRVGTWVHKGDSGETLVDLDLSQGTHEGSPLTRDQARILGLARNQDAIFDSGHAVADGVDPDVAFPDIYLSKDPRDRAIATHLREAVLNPRSGYSRYSRRLRSAIDSVIQASQASGMPSSLDHAWVDSYMDAAARLGQTAVNNGRFKNLDQFFAHMDVQFAKRATSNVATLNQTVLGLEPGPALDRALKEVDDIGAALRWYDDSHAALEKRWRFDRAGNERMTTLLDGTKRPTMEVLYDLLAVTSVMASPTENMGRALSGLANLGEWMDGQKNAAKAAERALVQLERLNTDKVKMGGKEVSRRLAESIGKDITKDTSMVGDPLYNVFDILEGRLNLATTDAEQLRSLPERWKDEGRSLSPQNVPDELVAHHREQAALEGLQGPEAETYAHERANMEHHGSKALAKLRSFRDNLANPETSRAVTLDSWMARMLGVPSTDFGKGGKYADLAQKLRATADAATAGGTPMSPHQLQALLWVFTKGEIGKQDYGRFLAASDATIEAIRAGHWAPDSDPTIDGWFDVNLGPSRESTQNPTITETQVETIRDRSDLGAVGTGNRQTETRRSLPYDAKTLAGKEKGVAGYEKIQATIAERLAAGDTEGAEKAYMGWANKQRRHLVGPDGNLHFGLIDEQAGPTAAVNTATQRLENLGQGPSDIDPVANAYFRKNAKKLGLKRPTPVDANQTVPPERGRAIADAYDALQSNPNDPEVKKAYRALTKEVEDQWKFITEDPNGPQLKVDFVERADNPYSANAADTAESHRLMLEDVREHNHLYVDKTGPDEAHPIWTPDQNDRFRAVHDYFGHSRVGNDFGRNGEEVAYQLHSQMFSDEANKVLATETRGQNSVLNFSEENVARKAAGEDAQFPEQKAGILPEEARAIPTEDDPGTVYQKFHDRIVGSFTPAEATKTGKAMIRLFDGADPTTMPHELGHMLYYLLGDDDLRTLDAEYGTGVLKQFHAAGTANRVAMEERFADDWSTFMMSKQAPNRTIGMVLDKIRGGMFNLWESMRSTMLRDRTPGPVQDVFDHWYEPEVQPIDVPELRSDIAHAPTDQTPAQLGQSLPAHPNEPAVVARRRGYRAGRDVERMASIDRQIKDAVVRKARLRKSLNDIQKMIAEHQLPAELVKGVIEGHVQRNINRLADGLDNPSVARTPAHLKPLWGAIKELHKEAEDNAPLAAALENIPEAFPDMLRWLADNGVRPEHVSSMTNSRVSQLVYESIQLGKNGRIGKVEEAATRKARAGAFTEAKGIDALAAGYLQGPHEANSNALVNYLEDVHVKDVPANGVIPNGYRAWDPERNFILRGEKTDDGFKLAGKGTKPTKMIPDAVAKTVDKFSRDYSHGAFKAVTAMTNPWRALILTWSPRWYVNNFVGNFMLATAEGVKITDWVSAWKSYRQRGEGAGLRQGVLDKSHPRLGNPFSDTPELAGESLAGEIGGQPHIISYPETHPTPRHPLGGKEGGVAMARRSNGRLEAYNVVAHKVARANEVVDEFARSAVYHKALRTGHNREFALTRSFEALVDYGNLTPFERQVVRSVVPFYSWQKGILKIVSRLAIDHPVALGITLQLANLNRELNIEEYGADLPSSYKGLVDVPGLGTLNTRGFNPFQDSTQLLTPQGIAASTNPFVEIGIRNALGAPDGGFVKHQREDEFGRVVPDTSPAEDFADIGTGLPQYQLGTGLLGNGAYQGAPTGVQAAERYVGVSAYRPDQVKKIIQRALKARQRTS